MCQGPSGTLRAPSPHIARARTPCLSHLPHLAQALPPVIALLSPLCQTDSNITKWIFFFDAHFLPGQLLHWMDVCQVLEPQVDALPLVRTLPHTHRRPLLPPTSATDRPSPAACTHPALPLALRSAEGDPCPRTGWMEMGWHTMPTPLLPSRGLFSSCSSLKPYCITTVTAGGMAHGGCPPAPSLFCCSSLPEQGTQLFSFIPCLHLLNFSPQQGRKKKKKL